MKDETCGIKTELMAAEISVWEQEVAQRPKILEWHGWNPDSDISATDFFNDNEVSCKCHCPCERCGFYYLDKNGETLERTGTPICGVW